LSLSDCRSNGRIGTLNVRVKTEETNEMRIKMEKGTFNK
jgi:hypothetical protein